MRLVDEAPTGSGWLQEIKYDGYWMHARIDSCKAQPLTWMGRAAQYDGRPSPLFAARLEHAVELFRAGIAKRLIVTGGKAGRLVAGFRGSPPADVAALTDLVHRLGRLAEDVPEVSELDLNPVLAGPDGCVAVDARVRLRSRPTDRALKSC